MFASPAAAGNGDSVKPADLHNHLCIFEPTLYQTDIETAMGKSDVITVTVHDLDANETHVDTWFFNVGIRSALKPRIGEKVLGRITQGVAKPGKTAPWIITDATGNPADVKKATDFLAAGFAPIAVSNGTPTPAQSTVTSDPAAALANINVNDPAVAALLAKLAGN